VGLAVADEQTLGRGRAGRGWTAPPGVALLLSTGFRPTYLEPPLVWRLAAIVALAMADAAEDTAGLPDGAIRLKWPNDLVVETGGPGALLGAETELRAARERLEAPVELRKLGGVLGETDGLGTPDPRAVVGIGINADWPAESFPPELAAGMTSLRVASGGRPIDRMALLEGFVGRLEPRLEALRSGRFPVGDWVDRQATTGRIVRLAESGDGPPREVRAIGVDPVAGGLVVADPAAPGGERIVLAADVDRVRVVADAVPAAARSEV
jgi:BirA family biotin operon repressor/biotin-[acetyl-CoA-carboxylase] ligase